MTRFTFLDPAEEEMRAAAAYYEAQVPGLGQEFLREVQRAIERIAEHPRSGTLVHGEVRRCLVGRFPFGILYRLDPEETVVLAVMHLRRRPGYWQDRL
jgi:plasmid stabilization system protein ParE